MPSLSRIAEGEHFVHRRFKIIATVGPASCRSRCVLLTQLVAAGVNVLRLKPVRTATTTTTASPSSAFAPRCR